MTCNCNDDYGLECFECAEKRTSVIDDLRAKLAAAQATIRRMSETCLIDTHQIGTLCERVKELEEALREMPVMLEECEARITGLLQAHKQEWDAYGKYFEYHGAEHSEEGCPEDDTCSCPEHQPMVEAMERMGRERELAGRRLDKIRKMRQALAGKKGGE